MKLYSASLSPNAQRCRAVAFELGVDIDIVDVDLRSGENKTEAYLGRNANGKVPMLVDGDFVVWESRAICSYLAGVAPKAGLYSDDNKTRALIDQWSWWQAVHLGPAMQKIAFEVLMKSRFGMGDPDAAAVEAERKNVALFMPVFEKGLEGKDWIAGDLSLADFYTASTFMFRHSTDISLAEFPNVTAWIERMEARPSWQKSLEPMQPLLG